MRVLILNSIIGAGSTGRIAENIAEEYDANGWEVRVGYGRVANVPGGCLKWSVRIGSSLSVRLHGVLTRLFDWHADRICSWWVTWKFLKWAEEWKPDLLWLHNLHGYYINYELLFQWIKRHPEMDVKWTLHDCWAFTGHCSHFLLTDCERWKSGCWGCPEKREYPASKLLSAAKANWERKRNAFCGVKKLTLITPSKWLAKLTRQSFLKEYPVEVHHNNVDENVFRRVRSDFKRRQGIANKVMILGVASNWELRKGLEDFISLRKMLGDRYAIVLIGLSRRQREDLPSDVIGLERTSSVDELVAMYSAADWFFNPTHEDNYPTVNLEARACGCRVVTYDTGGAAETVEDYDKAWVLKGANKSPEGFVRLLQKVDEVQDGR